MSNKIDKLVDELKNITLLEASELIAKIEDTFGVEANINTSFIPLASNLVNTKAEEVVKEEKTEFDVILNDVPSSKRINVIKVVRSLTSLGLKEAKDLIETVPKPVFEAVSKEKAEEVKKLLEEAGAVVSIN
uniref:Large ribosomal subunit protein bL12c n=1 Tax=Phacus pleuronectes TaxID=102908 RepID=A0A3G3LLV1_9EUGL|nr:ribosomal protein L12 [Phacus pleuronectes]AYQ93689.1 ribosomal protein L12 [Phacus pleuronectes]